MRKTTINNDNDHPGKIHRDFFLPPTKEDTIINKHPPVYQNDIHNSFLFFNCGFDTSTTQVQPSCQVIIVVVIVVVVTTATTRTTTR